MAESSFPVAHKRMLAYEGGWCNHPADPGGVTLNGVTQAVYDADRKARGLARKALTKAMNGDPAWNAERDSIYKRRYWQPPRCDALHPGVDAAIYDYSVNSGIGRGARVLQRLVGVKEDGRVGPETIKAALKRDAKALVEAICAERTAFLKSLKTWPTFGKGWGSRVADVRAYAVALATAGAVAYADRDPERDAPTAKGEVPEPKAVKNIVKAAPPAAGGGEIARDPTWLDWILTHPGQTAVVVVLAIAGIAIALKLISNWRQSKQETPMPGFGPLPKKG